MSKPPRYFVKPEQISSTSILLSDEDVRHIATVLRMKPGAILSLCDGIGSEYTAKIIDIARTKITAEIISTSKAALPVPSVTLAQGLPKYDKMDWIVQKTTELGVSRIVPVETERTIVKLKDQQKRLARWQKISREAAMQSRRASIPIISPVTRFDDFVGTSAHAGQSVLKLLPWEEGVQPIQEVLQSHPGIRDCIVLIGPEGGFSASEADRATASGFHLVSLGPNILRTETAAVAAVSMLLYHYQFR